MPEPDSDPRVTVVIITRNEAAAIADCVVSAQQLTSRILVVDSASSDGTPEIARRHGAAVVNFLWDGSYPKKKQWALSHPAIETDWVLQIDADERVTPGLAREICEQLSRRTPNVAYEVRLKYRFAGKDLRFGHRMHKRVLLARAHCRFPEIDDLGSRLGEVEGHYQPVCAGPVARLRQPLVHADPDPIETWVGRHNRYSDWEAFLAFDRESKSRVNDSRTREGRFFARLPFKPLVFFFYSYIVRLGFLDGRAGFDFAFALTWYYWLISVKRRELKAGSSPTLSRG